MARVAKTVGVSMFPEDRARWDRLRSGRQTAEFMRHLLDREEQERRNADQEALLAELLRFQDELPPAWKADAAWDLPEPDVSPISEDIAEATFDVGPVLASWRDGETP
jgi:hypothetical protein